MKETRPLIESPSGANAGILQHYKQLKKQKKSKKKDPKQADNSGSSDLNMTMLDSKSKKYKQKAFAQNFKASMIARTLDFELPEVTKNEIKSVEIANSG